MTSRFLLDQGKPTRFLMEDKELTRSYSVLSKYNLLKASFGTRIHFLDLEFHDSTLETTHQPNIMESVDRQVYPWGSSPLNKEIAEPDALEHAPETESLTRQSLLSAQTTESMKQWMHQFIKTSLIPFMEKSVVHLNSQLASLRKSTASRWFSASKKIFSYGGMAPPAISGHEKPTTAVFSAFEGEQIGGTGTNVVNGSVEPSRYIIVCVCVLLLISLCIENHPGVCFGHRNSRPGDLQICLSC
jgi:ER-Golgi trafficking TRAPP I complex 85 kDa subunit